MPYSQPLDPFAGTTATPISSARNWYALTNAMIGAAELPQYGKALRIRNGSGSVLTLVVVPVAEASDAATDTVTIETGVSYEPLGVRRLVSINGGATVPASVEIKIITQ